MRLRALLLALPLALAASTAAAQTFSGRLESGDETLESGEYRDLYRVSVRQGQYVRASLTSSDFDPYLLVRGAARDDDDDDSGEGLNALLTTQATESGELRITVTSAEKGETGAYRLVVTVQDTPFAEGDAAASSGTATSGASAGQDGRTVLSGELATGDQTLRTGEFGDVHTARVRPGQHVRIDMASPAFDTYLVVSGALSAQNDDIAPGRTMSRVEGVAGGDGQIRIVATSARPGETGRYLIVVLAQDQPFPPDGETTSGAASTSGSASSRPASSSSASSGAVRVTGLPMASGEHTTNVDGEAYAIYGMFSGGTTSTLTLPVRQGDEVYGYIDQDEQLPVVSLGMMGQPAIDRIQSGGAAARMRATLGQGGNPRLTGPVTAAQTGFVTAILIPDTQEPSPLPQVFRFLVKRPGGGDPTFRLYTMENGYARVRTLFQDGSRPYADAAYRTPGGAYVLPVVIAGLGGCEIDTGLTCYGPSMSDAERARTLFEAQVEALQSAIGGQEATMSPGQGVERQVVIDVPGGYRYSLLLIRAGDSYSLSFVGVKR